MAMDGKILRKGRYKIRVLPSSNYDSCAKLANTDFLAISGNVHSVHTPNSLSAGVTISLADVTHPERNETKSHETQQQHNSQTGNVLSAVFMQDRV